MKTAVILLVAALLLFPGGSALAEKPKAIGEQHFRIYDAKGNPTTLDALLQRMQEVDVVFLGESHDDPVAHHLQAKVLRALQDRCRARPGPLRPLALSLEMFERDVQPVLDEYLSGLITEKAFRDASRPWSNYQKDYRPLVEYAREQKLAVIAANAPRRYVNRVARLGAASLLDIPNPGRRGLPPLPYAVASPAYAAKFNEIMKKHGPKKDAKASPPARQPAPSGPPRMPPADDRKPAVSHGLEAQSLWDATMAYSIAEHLLRSPRARVLHVNGSFHSEKRMGIPEHLLRYRPGTSLLVVTLTSHKDFPKFHVGDLADGGDFVIVTDPKLPRSFGSKPPAKKKPA